jgi:hypothetical protein
MYEPYAGKTLSCYMSRHGFGATAYAYVASDGTPQVRLVATPSYIYGGDSGWIVGVTYTRGYFSSNFTVNMTPHGLNASYYAWSGEYADSDGCVANWPLS